MKTKSIKFADLVNDLYYRINNEIDNLKDSLNTQNPEEATQKFRETFEQMDKEDFANISQACAVLTTLLSLLVKFVPKEERDKEFEDEAGQWANVDAIL